MTFGDGALRGVGHQLRTLVAEHDDLRLVAAGAPRGPALLLVAARRATLAAAGGLQGVGVAAIGSAQAQGHSGGLIRAH